jgi:transcriptional regulator GlxA family with amidase domain
LSIKQVLHATGFRDRSHFSRSFHAMYGWAPREVRQATIERTCVRHAPEASWAKTA